MPKLIILICGLVYVCVCVYFDFHENNTIGQARIAPSVCFQPREPGPNRDDP